MAASNRASRIAHLVAALKKRYKPIAPSTQRSLLDNLLFACLLENSPHEAAERVFSSLKTGYFDLNEVRVSTRRELAEVMKPLNDPDESADRLKRTLQSVFETFYSFEIDSLQKQNLGQAIKMLRKLDGVTPFAVAYTTQTSLGGHSIPVNQGLFTALCTLEVITSAEAASCVTPGLERAIPKSKGIEVGSQLHQLGVEVGKSPYGQNARKTLLEIDPNCKDRLPKRPAKKVPDKKPSAKSPPAKAKPEVKPTAKKAPPKKAPSKKSTSTPPPPKKTAASKTPPKKKPVTKKSSPAKKKPAPPGKSSKSTPAKKGVVKKGVVKKGTAKKKVAKKGTTKKKVGKKASGLAKRKPR